MTPKEKATELWNKYVEAKIVTEGKYSNYRGLTTEHAKVCALIAVDEIINASPTNPLKSGYIELYSDMVDEAIIYWQEVKQEIEKL